MNSDKPRFIAIGGIAGIARYRKEHYQKLRVFFPDLPESFDDWELDAGRTENLLRLHGITVFPVEIDPEKFPTWCISKKFEINHETEKRYLMELALKLSARAK